MFLDEVNTSSCLGLFKEIIIDRTIDGKVSYCNANKSMIIDFINYILSLSTCSCKILFFKIVISGNNN